MVYGAVFFECQAICNFNFPLVSSLGIGFEHGG